MCVCAIIIIAIIVDFLLLVVVLFYFVYFLLFKHAFFACKTNEQSTCKIARPFSMRTFIHIIYMSLYHLCYFICAQTTQPKSKLNK